MDEIEKKLRAAGFPPEQIKAYMDSLKPSLKQEIHGGSADFLQGVTLGAGGLAIPDMKTSAEDFSKRHNILGPALKVAGTAAGALALPASWGVRALGRALVGGGSAAVAAGSEGDGTTAQRLKRAAVAAPFGAAAGVIAPEALGLTGKVASKLLKPYVSKARVVADAAGPLLPEGAEAVMARQEALVPGAAVPGTVSPEIPGTMGVIGANVPVSTAAKQQAVARLAKIKDALDGVSSQYQELLGNRRAPLSLPDGTNIRKLIVKYGQYPGDETAALMDVKTLRSDLLAKVKGAKGNARNILGKDVSALSDWLKQTAPGIEELDHNWNTISDMKRANISLLKTINQSRGQYAASRMTGIEPGSSAAKLPSRGGVLASALSPDRSKMSAMASKMLLQQGGIPKALLDAQRRSMLPPNGMPGLLGAFGLGAATPQATDPMADSLFGPQ